jgi:hypothetical protein
MKTLRTVAAVVVTACLAGIVPAHSTPDKPQSRAARDLSGLHAFDLRVGNWTCHHRRLKERLAGSNAWEEFEGTQTWWSTLNGFGNADDNLFHTPSGEVRGVTVRAYDPQSGQWAIWWFDGRNPLGPLDPPVIGRFVNGVGTFYSEDTWHGKPIRVRFIWSGITREAAHWEQAFSPDGGKTWETNWIADFRPAARSKGAAGG